MKTLEDMAAYDDEGNLVNSPWFEHMRDEALNGARECAVQASISFCLLIACCAIIITMQGVDAVEFWVFSAIGALDSLVFGFFFCMILKYVLFAKMIDRFLKGKN